MEILCNIPAQKRATAMLTAMMEALHTRMNSTPNFPDLASFLVRSMGFLRYGRH